MRSASSRRPTRVGRGVGVVRVVGVVAALSGLVALAGCSGGVSADAPTSTPSRSTTSSVPSTPTATAPSSASAAVTAALEPFYEQTLNWHSCGGFQCATLRVPMSYEAPSESDVIKLQVLRNPASSRSKRIGALVVNPGGPGGSGVSYAQRSDSVLPAALRARYDIVGFDPRGVQSSRPSIDCISDAQLDDYLESATSFANAAQQLRDSRTFANGCAARSPELYKEVGTRDAAKDMDVLRAALGEQNLNYLGKSYGTLLGATYAETFPSRVGHMVLDGVLDPSLDADSLLKGQAAGFERAYKSFLASCVRGSCPLGDDVDTAYAKTVTWVDGLEAHPLGPPGGRKLTKPLAQLAILGSLYEDRSQWPQLRQAFRSALNGSPTAMLALADNAVDREPGGHYPDNSNEAQYAITCLDRPYTATVAQTAARATRFAAFAPLFGEYIAWGDLPCTQWKAPPTRLPHRLDPAGIPPILLLGTTRDPATPLAWAKSLHSQLPNSRLLTWKGDGHTAFYRGSGCVDAITDAYLISGTLPATDPTCSGR